MTPPPDVTSGVPDGVQLNRGDIAWMLASTALTLLMSIPGLSMFYGGLVQPRNYIHTIMQSFTMTCLISTVWITFGYSLAFSPGCSFIGGSRRFFLLGLTPEDVHPVAPAIPEALFMTFQMTFAIITPALITGAPAERMKFSSLLVFSALWSLLVYSPVAHWAWHPEGFLKRASVLDFAGGDVVHVNSGAAALVTSIVLGKRSGKTFPPQNITISLTGASFLWVGWFGFNSGSALAADKAAAFALAGTQLAGASGGLSSMLVEWANSGRPTVLSVISGAVAGLVAITPACGYVDFTGSFFIGFTAGFLCYYSVRIKDKFGFDDALDVFGMHGVGGIYGGLATGLYANPAVDPTCAGLFYGNGWQLARQAYGIVVVFIYSAIVTYILLKVIQGTMGLRVHRIHEEVGLDTTVHGERIYFERARSDAALVALGESRWAVAPRSSAIAATGGDVTPSRPGKSEVDTAGLLERQQPPAAGD